MTEAEIQEVSEALRSGWITTGPRVKEFERLIAMCCGTTREDAGGNALHTAVCLNSATACMEMALRVLGVGPGDEVIVPAYTYTATASVPMSSTRERKSLFRWIWAVWYAIMTRCSPLSKKNAPFSVRRTRCNKLSDAS